MKELSIRTHIYLELKDGETENQGKERLYDILFKLGETEKGLIVGDMDIIES